MESVLWFLLGGVAGWAGTYALRKRGVIEESIEPYWASSEGRQKLVSTSNTQSAERLIRRAYRAKFFSRPLDVFYEHGRWWVRTRLWTRDGYPGVYAVVDAVPGVAGTGVDFEEV